MLRNLLKAGKKRRARWQLPSILQRARRQRARAPAITAALDRIALRGDGTGRRGPTSREDVAASWDRALRKTIGGGNAGWRMDADRPAASGGGWDRAFRAIGAPGYKK